MIDKDAMLQRINALILKAESTEHPEEAKVFMEKAQELLSKYSLSEFDLKSASTLGSDTVATIAVMVQNPFINQKSTLLAQVARANNIKVVQGQIHHRSNKSQQPHTDTWTNEKPRVITSEKASVYYRYMYLTGFTRDIDATILLYTSFLLQITSETKRAEVPSYVNKGTWTAHFILGFADEVGRRLRVANNKAQHEFVAEAQATGNDMLPVLASRAAQVESAHEMMWSGNLGRARSRSTHSFTGGQAAGRSAASTADIGNKRIGGAAALGRGN